jgi:dynactin complex subunit
MKKLMFLFVAIMLNASGMYSENYIKYNCKRSYSEMAEISDEGSRSKKMRENNNSEMSLDSYENFNRKMSYSEITEGSSEDIQREKGKEIIYEGNVETDKISYQEIFSKIEALRQEIMKPSSVNSHKSQKEKRERLLEKIKRKKQKKNSRIEELQNQNLFLKSKIEELTKQIEEIKREKLRLRNLEEQNFSDNNLSPRSRKLDKKKKQLYDLYEKNRDMLAYYRAYSPLKKLVIKSEDLVNIPIEILEFPKLKEIVILGDLSQSQKNRNKLSDLISKASHLEVLKFR